MKVGILGSGDVAQALGKGFLETGHEVRLGTRDPKSEKMVAWKAASGAKASVGTFQDTSHFGEIVVIATRGVEAVGVVKGAGPEAFAGKLVIDVTNPLVFAPNSPPQLSVGHTDSLGEQIQRALPSAHVVKAFNTVGSLHMFRPQFPGDGPDMFIAGNDAKSKERVTEILHSFGWHGVVDAGGIDSARLLEPMCVLWVRSAMTLGSWDVAFKLLRK